MNCSHLVASRAGALLGAMLLTVSQASAQNPTTNTDAGAAPVKKGRADSDTWRLSGRSADDKALQLLTDDYERLASQWLLAAVLDPADELLGATLRPVDDTLRAQLGIAKGQGLLIAGLRSDGASAKAGLKQNDVLLSLGDKPLAAADDLTKNLKTAGESAVDLKILRAGKPTTIQVRPIFRVTIGPVARKKAEYYIGISINPADDALRAQLGLSGKQGVVVQDVVSGSPAEKAGVKKHDVVLELGGKPIDSPETLAREVQVIQDKPTTLKVLRGGKPMTIPVTGAVKKVEVDLAQEAALVEGDVRLWLVDQPDPSLSENYIRLKGLDSGIDPRSPHLGELRQRLDRVERELKALRETLERVNQTIKEVNKPTKKE
jgi:serine protease Do